MMICMTGGIIGAAITIDAEDVWRRRRALAGTACSIAPHTAVALTVQRARLHALTVGTLLPGLTAATFVGRSLTASRCRHQGDDKHERRRALSRNSALHEVAGHDKFPRETPRLSH